MGFVHALSAERHYIKRYVFDAGYELAKNALNKRDRVAAQQTPAHVPHINAADKAAAVEKQPESSTVDHAGAKLNTK